MVFLKGEIQSVDHWSADFYVLTVFSEVSIKKVK